MDKAAELYVLAEDFDGAVRMHMARAARAPDRNAELAALRDALRWTNAQPELVVLASAGLGKALLAAAKAEGVTTERDRERVTEAAALLVAGEQYARAGEAYEFIGDLANAAAAYSAGGFVEKLEATLAREDAASAELRAESEAMASYEAHLAMGQRDAACADLRTAIAHSARPQAAQRKLDALLATLLTSGRVVLQDPSSRRWVGCAGPRIMIGRDPLCHVVLATAGVSRQHAEIELRREAALGERLRLSAGDVDASVAAYANRATPALPDALRDSGGAETALAVTAPHHTDAVQCCIRDLQSRNGVTVDGLPIVGDYILGQRGRVALGPDAKFTFERQADAGLALEFTGGRDHGLAVSVGETTVKMRQAGVVVTVEFRHGRPWLQTGGDIAVDMGGTFVRHGWVQLVRGDRVHAGTCVWMVDG